jgi:hypothetical protein
MTKLVTALLILGVSFSSAQAQLPCSAWTATRNSADTDDLANAQMFWIDGYLSGRIPGWQSPRSYAASMMEEWITSYCARHSKSDVTEAATAFVRQHTPEQIAAGD